MTAPVWLLLMAGAVRSLLGDELQLRTDAPAPLAIELRRQPGRLLLHLLNNVADGVFPIGAVLPAGKVHLARSLVLDQRWYYRQYACS